MGIGLFARVSLDMELVAGKSAATSVTFLSGVNSGKTFDAIYNPDFHIGETANILRLPEGVTASIGDKYTIDNIVKSKVPVKILKSLKELQPDIS